MAELIYLDDIVQSTECWASDGEMACLLGFREEGRKESLRDSAGEEDECSSRHLGRGVGGW